MQSDIIDQSTFGTSTVLPPATGSSNINVGPVERVASVLVGTAAAVYGLRQISKPYGIALALTGAQLVYRGATGYCMVNKAIGRNSNTTIRKTAPMEIQHTLIVNKPKSEVYAFWRNLENLPLFMKHLQKVEEEDSVNSIWRAHVPGHVGTISWRAVITEDIPNQSLIWSSKPGSTVDTAGEVHFSDRADNSCELRIRMTYRLPAGDIGTLAGKLFSPAVEKMISEDLQRFKTLMESGEFSALQNEVSVNSGTRSTISSMPGESTVTDAADLSSASQERTRKGRTSRKKPGLPSESKEIEQNAKFPDPDMNPTYGDSF
jgi:uncharacterized membrane protein